MNFALIAVLAILGLQFSIVAAVGILFYFDTPREHRRGRNALVWLVVKSVMRRKLSRLVRD